MTDSDKNLIMRYVWIFQPYNNPNTNLKSNTKRGHWAQNQASAMAIPVLWPAPCRKWVGWTEEKKHQRGAVNLKDLEWFWMKEWSLISCQVFKPHHYSIIGEHLELLNRKVLNRIKNKIFCLHNLCVMVSRLDTDECLNNAVYLLIQQLWEQGKMVSMTFSSLTRE